MLPDTAKGFYRSNSNTTGKQLNLTVSYGQLNSQGQNVTDYVSFRSLFFVLSFSFSFFFPFLSLNIPLTFALLCFRAES